jgi:hypothetical protein
MREIIFINILNIKMPKIKYYHPKGDPASQVKAKWKNQRNNTKGYCWGYPQTHRLRYKS